MDITKDNIAYVRRLNRLLLKHVHYAIIKKLPAGPVEHRLLLAKYDRMFGIKKSLVSVLSEIADIELRIEKQRPEPQAADEGLTLDEKDVAIVKHYLQTQQGDTASA